MDNLVQHIDAVLQKYQPKRLIIACSAGLDSTTLLHACSRLEVPIEIAHVNYQLRGEESEEDQHFLESLAKNLDVPIHVKRVDLAATLKVSGNLQDEARKARYQLFDALVNKSKGSYVLLAHHKQDQTETFFMNLARNSGVMGLAAMPERRGHYIRPLLNISKEDLRNFAQRNELTWREDSSNASLKYTRNEWRNVVLPELRTTIPTLDDSVEILTKAFQAKQEELSNRMQSVIQEILDTQVLPKPKFESMDAFETIELCRQFNQPIGMMKTWKRLSLKGTEVQLQRNKNCPFDKIVFDGDSYSFVSNSASTSLNLKVEKISNLPASFNKQEVYFDASLLEGALQLRPVQTGDRIRPIGMKGSRLVSDVISDAKLTSLQKQQLRIVADTKDVLWVPNLCVSRKAIASKQSPEILKVWVEDAPS